ncbi:MAG: MFS transporter [Clostridia bacterium]|nr:MFS transporter [Clostridia bacterium]
MSRASSLSLLYREAGLTKAVSRSLNLILLGNLFGNLFGTICGGGTTPMNGLASSLHAGDLTWGIIGAIPQVAALMQIPFSILVNRTQKRKTYLLTFGLISRAIWILIGLITFLVPESPEFLRLGTLLLLLTISSCFSSAINVCWFPWFSDLAPTGIRGRWFSIRDTIIAGAGLLFGLLTGLLMDALPESTRYAVVFTLGGVLGILDMICFGFCEEVHRPPKEHVHTLSMVRSVFQEKPFVRFMVMWTAWCFTANLCEPYLNRYSMNEMGLGYTQMMIFSTASAAISTMLVMRFWGRALDTYGTRSVMMAAALVASLANAFYLFSAPRSVFPVFLRNFVGAAFWCGSNLAANSLQLSLSPDETRPSFLAIFSCITALLGTALGTFLGGVLLETWEHLGWFTGAFDRYKALILLSTALRFLTVVLFVPRLPEDRAGGIRAMLKGLFQSMQRLRIAAR